MATNLNVTFDGVNSVPRLPGNGESEWFSGFLGYYSQWGGDDRFEAVANLTGSNWTVNTMRILGNDNFTTIRDSDAGEGRRIDFLQLGRNSDVDLISTNVNFIFGWDQGDKHDIKLGDQTSGVVQAVHVYAAENIVETGAGYVVSINTETADSVSRIIVNEGGAGSVVTGGGNDRIVVNEGFVQSIRVNDGDDTVILRDGGFVRSLDINNGNDSVTVNANSRITSADAFTGNKTFVVEDGGRIDQIRGGEGNKLDVTLKGQARVETITAYSTELNLVTGDRFLQAVKGFDVDSDIKIGSGGVGNIRLTSDGENSHKVVSDGFVGSVDFDDSNANPDDDQSSNLTFKFFFGNVRLGEGKDNVKAVGADAWGESIATNGGNDRVELDNIGAGAVSLGSGNDTISLKKLADDDADNFFGNVQIKGGTGTDTILFNKFGGKVTFSLANSAGAQEISGNDRAFQVNGIENVTGSNKADDLTGSAKANVIKGGKGNDRIAGLEGNDTLDGAGGRDVFVFGANGGKDDIRGFKKGQDTIEIADNAGKFKALSISKAGQNLEIEYDGGMITLLGRGGVNLTANDFDFV